MCNTKIHHPRMKQNRVRADETNNFVMAYTETQTGNPVPMTVTFKLPEDYSVLQQTEAANKSINDHYNIFTWQFEQGVNIPCSAVFMPFSIEPTVRSMGISIEALTNSASTGLKETFNMTYDLIGTVMIWNVSLVMPINIPFPTNESGTQIESVYDGQGQSKLRTEPINPNAINPLGKYFVDNKNKLVTIYPRNSYQDVTQKFDIQITFIVPNNLSDNTINPNIPFYQPYKGFSSLVFSFQNSPMLRLNLTGNFKVTFIFPQDRDSFSSSDGEPFVEAEEDGKPTVTFNYNSPINLPKEQWIVLFDNISRGNFFVKMYDECYHSYRKQNLTYYTSNHKKIRPS